MTEATTKLTYDGIDAELKKLYDADPDTSDEKYFDRALELGASLEYLGDLALPYVTRDKRLPWARKLIEAGFDKGAIRCLIAELCFKRGDRGDNQPSQSDHRRAFLNDEEAWMAFDTVDVFVEFLIKVAECEPENTLERRDAIANEIGSRRQAVEAGLAEANMIAIRAARNIQCLWSDRALKVIKTLPINVQIHACRAILPRDGRVLHVHQLQLVGHVLGEGKGDSRDREEILWRLCSLLEKKPEEGLCMIPPHLAYRLLLLGGSDGPNTPNRFRLCREHAEIRKIVEKQGWAFHRLQRREDSKRPGRGDLQVDLGGYPRIVIKHDHRDYGRDEFLREGDEVMIPKQKPDEWQPVYQNDRIRIYQEELHAAAPPTKKMLERPESFKVKPEKKGKK